MARKGADGTRCLVDQIDRRCRLDAGWGNRGFSIGRGGGMTVVNAAERTNRPLALRIGPLLGRLSPWLGRSELGAYKENGWSGVWSP